MTINGFFPPFVGSTPAPTSALFFVVGKSPNEGSAPIITRSVSSDASAWSDVSPASPEEGNITSITTGLGIFVAGGQDEDAGFGVILTSNDGLAPWTPQTHDFISANAKVTTVAFGGGVFIAGGFTSAGAKLQSSLDAVTWTNRTIFTGFSVWGSFYDGAQFLLGGQANDFSGALQTSPNGTTWTSQTNNFNESGGKVIAFAFDGTTHVAVGTAGNHAEIETSVDGGVTWVTQVQGFGATSQALGVAFGNGTFVAVGQGDPGGDHAHIETSLDGITWTPRTSNFAGAAIIQSISFGNGLFIITGINGSNDPQIDTSPDGITWTTVTNAFPAGDGTGLGTLAV